MRDASGGQAVLLGGWAFEVEELSLWCLPQNREGWRQGELGSFPLCSRFRYSCLKPILACRLLRIQLLGPSG